MSASKSKSPQKGKSKSKKATATNQREDGLEEFSSPDETKKTQPFDQKPVKKSKGDEDGNSDLEENQDTEEKAPESGAKDQSSEPPFGGQSRKNESKETLSNGRCFSLSSWFEKLPRLPGSQFRYRPQQNGAVPAEIERQKQKLFQKLGPYQHKISSYSTAFVIRTKILILAIFWLHVLSWLGLSLLLGLVNVFTFFAGPWSLFPIFGWYLILLCHFFITHRLLKGAGQNDLEWVDTKLWEYIDRIKEFSSESFSTCKEKSQLVIVQTRTTLSNGYTHVKTYAYRLPQYMRKREGQKSG